MPIPAIIWGFAAVGLTTGYVLDKTDDVIESTGEAGKKLTPLATMVSVLIGGYIYLKYMKGG